MKKFPILLVLSLLVLLTACNSTPSPDIAQKYIQTVLDHYKPGIFEIIEFQKVNGVEQTIQGMKAYEMEYKASIRALKNAGNMRITTLMNFSDALGRTNGNIASVFIGAQKGKTISLNAKIYLIKTEKGWQVR